MVPGRGEPARTRDFDTFTQNVLAMRCRPYRIPALVLIAAAAWLAAVPPATSQEVGFEPPRLLNEREIAQQIGARYPPAQRDSAVRGYVVLNFRVREDSTVDPVSVSVREASNPAFVAPATALVPAMRFAPARVGGRIMAAWITQTIPFEIQRPRPGVERAVPPNEGTYELAAVDELPMLRDRERAARRIAAAFPPALRDSGVAAGAVMVRFRIMENGTVDAASPRVEMTTEPRFDEAAISVIRQMRFQPAKLNGRPVKAWVVMPIQFQAPAPAPSEAAGTVPRAG